MWKLVVVVVAVQFNLLIHQTCWHTIMLNNETCNEYKQNIGSSVYIMNIHKLHVYMTSNCMYASSVGIITPPPPK